MIARTAPGKIRRTAEDRTIDAFVAVVLAVVGIVTLYPFYYTVICSFNNGSDLLKGGIYLWPRKFSIDAYSEFLSDQDWINAMMITLSRTLLGAVLSTFFTCLVSYGLSRKELMFRKVYRFIVVFTMYFSGGIIPYYVQLRNLGLLNTYWVYIIPWMFSSFFAIVGMNFFSSIPDSMVEAARIDGARELHLFLRIIIPVSLPLIATMLLFQGVNQWNSWLDSAYYVRDRWLHTLAYKVMITINKGQDTTGLSAMSMGEMSQAKTTSHFNVQCTAMVISMVPIACVYPFLQKYFVQGMMLGSVKE